MGGRSEGGPKRGSMKASETDPASVPAHDRLLSHDMCAIRMGSGGMLKRGPACFVANSKEFCGHTRTKDDRAPVSMGCGLHLSG